MRKTIKESTIRKIIRKELIREAKAEENQPRLDDKLDIAFNQVNIDVKGESAVLIKVVKKIIHLFLFAMDKDAFQNMTGEAGSNILGISQELSKLITNLNEAQMKKVVDAVQKLNTVIKQSKEPARKSQKN